MIRELAKAGFPTVERLLPTDDDFPEARSVLRGTNPGWVFVDDPERPRAALIWSRGIEGFYLVGHVDSNAFRDGLDAYVREIITPRAAKLGLDWFEVSGDRAAWDRSIERIFASRRVETGRQCIYRSSRSVRRSLPSSPQEDPGAIRKIDAALLSEDRLGDAEILHTKVSRFWGNPEKFLSKGIGYAVTRGGVVASLCLSAFVAGNVHAVDIETVASCQRQGLARAAAMAFLDECAQRRLEPHWDCMAENAASRALAERLGFELVREYDLHYFRFEEKTD